KPLSPRPEGLGYQTGKGSPRLPFGPRASGLCLLCASVSLWLINYSRQQMRPQEGRAVLLEQRFEDLLIAQACVDQAGDSLAHGVGHAAAVGVAARQGVEVAGTGVVRDGAGAVDAGQEPLDALLLRARPV